MAIFNSLCGCCFEKVYQSWLDKSTPFYAVRWAATLLLTAVYMIRVYILQVMFFVFVFVFTSMLSALESHHYVIIKTLPHKLFTCSVINTTIHCCPWIEKLGVAATIVLCLLMHMLPPSPAHTVFTSCLSLTLWIWFLCIFWSFSETNVIVNFSKSIASVVLY